MDDQGKDTVLQMKTLNVELRKKLEMVSKWRGSARNVSIVL